MAETRNTRPFSWIKAALKDFDAFPERARSSLLTALTIAAEGGKADISKPLQGLGPGVFEIALAFRGDAFCVVYAVHLTDEIWVIHAFQKKSKQSIKTLSFVCEPVFRRSTTSASVSAPPIVLVDLATRSCFALASTNGVRSSLSNSFRRRSPEVSDPDLV